MSILDAPAVDLTGTGFQTLTATRDVLPEVIFHFDASTLTGTNGSTVGYWPDSGPMGWDVWQDTVANRPLLVTAGLNGRNYVNAQAGGYLARQSAINTTFLEGGGSFALPLSFFAVVRVKSGSYTVNRAAVGGTQFWLGVVGSSSNGNEVCLSMQNQIQGDEVGDDTWHIVAGVADTNNGAVWVDGALAASRSSTPGTYSADLRGVGARSDGSFPFYGDIAELIGVPGRLNHGRVADITAALARKWGLS